MRFLSGIACLLFVSTPAWSGESTGGDDWLSVDASADYGCAVTEAGALACWGNRPWQQNGHWKSWEPQRVDASQVFTAVATGDGHVCALDEQGAAHCWGTTDDPRLGLGGAEGSEQQPRPVAGAGAFTAISAASRHTCALSKSGTVYCWGFNGSGQLGVPGKRSSTPAEVDLSVESEAIATGQKFSCALGRDGKVRCWGAWPNGDNSASWRPVEVSGEGFRALDAHAKGVCAAGTPGLKCWPDSLIGASSSRAQAAETGDSTDDLERPATAGYVELEIGAGWACGRTEQGEVECRGANSHGQLGDGTTESRATPRAVDSDAEFVDFAAGESHACGVTDDGELQCWGEGSTGRLGFHVFPRNVVRDFGRDAPSARILGFVGSRRPDDEGCTIRARSADPCPYFRMEEESFLKEPSEASVAIGADHFCKIGRAGLVSCGGDGTWGQVGNGSYRTRYNLAEIAGSAERKYEAITAGPRHTCGRTTEGGVECWGTNAHGEMGSTAGDSSPEPTPVAGDRAFDQLVAGRFHTCGRTGGGEAYCWGDNRFGQLGVDAGESSSTPVEVTGEHEFEQLATFGAHTCGVATDGGLLCWGRNTRRQLGRTAGERSLEPVRVGVDGAVDSVTVSRHHTCALTDSGEVYCWGLGVAEPKLVAAHDGIDRLDSGGAVNRKTCMFDEESRRLACVEFARFDGVSVSSDGSKWTPKVTTPRTVGRNE